MDAGILQSMNILRAEARQVNARRSIVVRYDSLSLAAGSGASRSDNETWASGGTRTVRAGRRITHDENGQSRAQFQNLYWI